MFCDMYTEEVIWSMLIALCGMYVWRNVVYSDDVLWCMYMT